MTKVQSYDQEYNTINHAYNVIFDSLQVLIEAEDSDPDVCNAINYALNVLDPALDRMKAEKTPKGAAAAPVMQVMTGNDEEESPEPEEEKSKNKKDEGKKKHGFVLKFPGSK